MQQHVSQALHRYPPVAADGVEAVFVGGEVPRGSDEHRAVGLDREPATAVRAVSATVPA